MAEGTQPRHYIPPRVKRGPRKPHNKVKDEEELAADPKIIIKKRPPRRPKLPNGCTIPCASTSQAVGSDNIDPAVNYDMLLAVETLTEKAELEQELYPFGGGFSSVDVQISYPEPEKVDSTTPSTPENLAKKNRRRVRRHKNKGRKGSYGDDEEENSKNVDSPGTSTYDQNKQYLKEQVSETKNKSDACKKPSEKDKKKPKARRIFADHMCPQVIEKILEIQIPESPKLIQGHIRINPRCYQNAYVPLATGEQDVLIIGLKDRNRAFEGDLVAVTINDQDKWFKLNGDVYQKTGVVVGILEKVHPRKAVGFLEKKDVFIFMKPRDMRVPIIRINARSVPRNFYDNPELYKDTLFLCDIVDWKKVAFAEGKIKQMVGNKGDLSVETNAILLENDLSLTPYGDELLKDLPPADYIPTEVDIANREDLRKTCIFTIDPATAVDLDDALSCKPLENGNFEIGVHIADVTHFLEAFSPLDRKVAERATTVYLVDNVYHMLPKQLCLACSLLPGQDKLAFSVILEMTPKADIVKHRFAKTVINSCCQMSYDQAQIMIDDDEYDWKKNGTLKISGNYTPLDLCKFVRNLYKLSTQLKQRRFDEGALRIDQAKLNMFLDKETGLPIGYKLEDQKESNSLIEEFMLLANMTVAKHLYETLPEVSLLRSHAEPTMRILGKTRDLLKKFGVLLDVNSAGSLYNSLLMYEPGPTDEPDDNTRVARYRMMVINSLCAKSMTRAVYKCSSTAKTKYNLKHYALNAEFYTHFTSPIRRYPDCVVHRLLYASIDNSPLHAEWSSEVCAKVASTCNTKKYSAKMAQEQSSALYFTYMLDLRGSMNALAIVMDVKERSADAMLCDTGLKLRLYYSDTVEETTAEFTMADDVPTVKLTWVKSKVAQVINIFSILNVKITKHPQLFRLQGIILPPVDVNQLNGEALKAVKTDADTLVETATEANDGIADVTLEKTITEGVADISLASTMTEAGDGITDISLETTMTEASDGIADVSVETTLGGSDEVAKITESIASVVVSVKAGVEEVDMKEVTVGIKDVSVTTKATMKSVKSTKTKKSAEPVAVENTNMKKCTKAVNIKV